MLDWRMSSPRIVVFTRWPQRGLCKTRLIPRLGAQGAADLHRRLTERTMAAVRAAGVLPEVRTTGADGEVFAGWLGDDLTYADQGEGDLGARLLRAAQACPVILLGSDAPDLAPSHLRAAMKALDEASVVIGPAEDGGYWLLGLREPAPHVFADMPWGADALFDTTVACVRAHGAEPRILDRLADLDRPEDLARWPELVA